MQTQTLRESEDATLNSAKRRSRARMQKYIERKRAEEDAAIAQRQHSEAGAPTPMNDAPDRSSLEGEVRRLQTQLTESEERVLLFTKAENYFIPHNGRHPSLLRRQQIHARTRPMAHERTRALACAHRMPSAGP